ncbi:MAG: hypothetical protein WC982_14205, partial [Advenella sp.]
GTPLLISPGTRGRWKWCMNVTRGNNDMWRKIKPYFIGALSAIGAVVAYLLGRNTTTGGNDNTGNYQRALDELERERATLEREREQLRQERDAIDRERERLGVESGEVKRERAIADREREIADRDRDLLEELRRRSQPE